MKDGMKNKWTVSVIIPAFNVQDYIGRAIESVCAQTHPADEIIIVDDGSTDNTRRIVQQYGSKVTCISQENAGAAQARNRGIEAARSKWIAFLDADDTYEPQKLKQQIELLERNPDLVWCYGNYQTCHYGTEQIQWTHDPARAETYLSGKEYFDDYLETYAAGFPGSTNTIMVCKQVLHEIGNFDKLLPWGQDADVFFKIAYLYPKIGYVKQSLAVAYFMRPGSITDTHWDQIDIRCEFLQRHLALSQKAGRRDAFEICAGTLLKRWIRQMMQQQVSGAKIWKMVKQFHSLIPGNLRKEAWLRCHIPWLGPLMLDGYFRIKNRFLSLSKKSCNPS